MNSAVFMLRALSLGLRIEDLDQLEEGAVTDMLIEQDNDQHPELYNYLPTQEDFDRF